MISWLGTFWVFENIQKVDRGIVLEGMTIDAKLYVEECSICQQNKSKSLLPVGLLQPQPISDRIWEDNTMDFIESLPKFNSFDLIMVIVDRTVLPSNILFLPRT